MAASHPRRYKPPGSVVVYLSNSSGSTPPGDSAPAHCTHVSVGVDDGSAHPQRLLFCPQNSILCGFGNTKFDDRLSWNLDLLLRLWIEPRARLPLLFHQLAKTGQDKFTVLFNFFVGERAERIEEYSSGPFVGLGGFGKCALKFCLSHLKRIRRCSVAQVRNLAVLSNVVQPAGKLVQVFGHYDNYLTRPISSYLPCGGNPIPPKPGIGVSSAEPQSGLALPSSSGNPGFRNAFLPAETAG